MYTVLVGHPAVGKGGAMNPIINLLKEASTANVLSDRLTIEWVLERLSKGFPSYSVGTSPGTIQVGTTGEATAILYAPELSVFFRSNSDTLSDLSDLWDSREQPFQYGTRGRGHFTITKPSVSLLGGSAPEWLKKSIPADAAGGGFTRRVNFVFAKEPSKRLAFPPNHLPPWDDLIHDLRYMMFKIQGEFAFDKAAEKEWQLYYNSIKIDEFDDEVIASYKGTKPVHVLKLCIAMNAAESDDRIVGVKTLQEAISKIEGVAQALSYVFRALGESDMATAADRVLRFVEARGYASRTEIMKANWRHVNAEQLTQILSTLIDGGLIVEYMLGNKVMYKPI